MKLFKGSKSPSTSKKEATPLDELKKRWAQEDAEEKEVLERVEKKLSRYKDFGDVLAETVPIRKQGE